MCLVHTCRRRNKKRVITCILAAAAAAVLSNTKSTNSSFSVGSFLQLAQKPTTSSPQASYLI